VSIQPGADELRIRSLLVARGVGPDAIPPKPAARPRDWLDDILDSNPAPAVEEPTEPEPAAEPTVEAPVKEQQQRPKKKRAKDGKRPKPGAARTAWDTRPPAPRQSLTEAWDRVPYRLRWLAYHATAAYLGWSVGLVGWSTYVTAWIADTGPVGPQAFFWYAVAGLTVLIYRRTRGWWTPAAWLAAVPATSTVVGVLLYAPHP
jgi:hypothetical protein